MHEPEGPTTASKPSKAAITFFAIARASTLSPLYYTQLLWATLIGVVAFGHLPDAFGLAGIAVIAGSGLLVALGERRSKTGAD